MAPTGIAMVALLVVLGLHSATATQYTVGLTAGWTFQSSNTFYTDEFQSIKLVVGDTLLFPYTSGQHNVYEIAPSQLSSCNFNNPIAKYTSGNSIVALTTPGVHAFACQFPSHCTAGMQLSVTVAAAAPAPAPKTPPTPAPVSPPTPAPVSPPTPPPKSPPTPAPAPAKSAPVPAPSKTAPAPAPAKFAPVPAPTIKAPAPSPKSPSKAPTKAPIEAPAPTAGAPATIVPISEAPAPAPASPGNSGSSSISSGAAMLMAATVAGLAFLLV